MAGILLNNHFFNATACYLKTVLISDHLGIDFVLLRCFFEHMSGTTSE